MLTVNEDMNLNYDKVSELMNEMNTYFKSIVKQNIHSKNEGDLYYKENAELIKQLQYTSFFMSKLATMKQSKKAGIS